MKKTVLAAFLVLTTTLTACGGGNNTPDTNTNPSTNPGTNPGTPSPSGIVSRLAACPEVNGTSDATFSTCLAGTYTGKTSLGKDCTLTVSANGSYSFSSPELAYSYAVDGKETRTFSHYKVENSHVLDWGMSGDVELDPADGYQPDTTYQLKFSAMFGQNAPNQKLEITAEQYKSATHKTTASTCILPL